MAEYSVGDALRRLIRQSGWTDRINEYRVKEEWAQIAGVTIARYTGGIMLRDRVLTISTEVAPLRQELVLGKQQLIEKINAHFQETVVLDIKIR
jgi:predicted nucleic acid-binding Zn ribbon protein